MPRKSSQVRSQTTRKISNPKLHSHVVSTKKVYVANLRIMKMGGSPTCMCVLYVTKVANLTLSLPKIAKNQKTNEALQCCSAKKSKLGWL